MRASFERTRQRTAKRMREMAAELMQLADKVELDPEYEENAADMRKIAAFLDQDADDIETEVG